QLIDLLVKFTPENSTIPRIPPQPGRHQGLLCDAALSWPKGSLRRLFTALRSRPTMRRSCVPVRGAHQHCDVRASGLSPLLCSREGPLYPSHAHLIARRALDLFDVQIEGLDSASDLDDRLKYLFEVFRTVEQPLWLRPLKFACKLHLPV